MGTTKKCYQRPNINVGDWVVHNGNYSYPRWPRGEAREVKGLHFDAETGCYALRIWNPNRVNGPGLSHYNPNNFHVVSKPCTDEDQNMAKEPTTDRFFAIKLNMSLEDLDKKQEDVPHLLMKGKAENGGFHLADINTDPEVDVNHYDTTPLRDSRTKVTNDVRDLIKEGERWVICEAIAFIDGEPPRPPIKLVELR